MSVAVSVSPGNARPTPPSTSTAEHAITLMLAVNREFDLQIDSLTAGT